MCIIRLSRIQACPSLGLALSAFGASPFLEEGNTNQDNHVLDFRDVRSVCRYNMVYARRGSKSRNRSQIVQILQQLCIISKTIRVVLSEISQSFLGQRKNRTYLRINIRRS